MTEEITQEQLTEIQVVKKRKLKKPMKKDPNFLKRKKLDWY